MYQELTLNSTQFKGLYIIALFNTYNTLIS